PDGDFTAVLGGQHHYTHDALAVDLEVILADPHVGAEAGRELDEFSGGPGVQAVLVPDRNRAFVIDGRRAHSTTLRSVPRSTKAMSARKTGSRTALPKRMPSRAAAAAATSHGMGMAPSASGPRPRKAPPATARGRSNPVRNAPKTVRMR